MPKVVKIDIPATNGFIQVYVVNQRLSRGCSILH
jgi:hypothetical protein